MYSQISGFKPREKRSIFSDSVISGISMVMRENSLAKVVTSLVYLNCDNFSLADRALFSGENLLISALLSSDQVLTESVELWVIYHE